MVFYAQSTGAVKSRRKREETKKNKNRMEYGTVHTTSTNTTGYPSMSGRIEPTTPSIETGMEKHWAAFSSNSSLPHKSTSLFKQLFRAQEVCESRGGRPGLNVPDSSKGLCGRIATLNLKLLYTRSPDICGTGVTESLVRASDPYLCC